MASRRWLTVRGLRFKIRRWPHLRRQLALDDWLRDTKLTVGLNADTLHRWFTPLEAMRVGRAHADAFDDAYAAFELLRAVLNSVEAFYRYSVQLGAPQPLGRTKPPPVYGVFREDGTFETSYVEPNPPSKYDRPRIPRDELRKADQHLRQFARLRSPKATITLVEKAIQKYGQALDTVDWPAAFLSLWQALELLTHQPQSNYNIRDVCRRANTLLGNDPLLTDVLHTCYDTRNLLVHRGAFSDHALREVQMLKVVVELCIDAVYLLRRQCPDWSSLLAYYQHATLSDADLARRRRVIGAIGRGRATRVKRDGRADRHP